MASSSCWQLRSEPQSQQQAPVPMPELIWKILQSRGVTSTDKINQYLSPKLQDLTNPYELDGMKTAVDHLVKAYKNSKKICLYGDFDLDGTSGLALLLKGFESLGYKNLKHYQPKRLSEGYGLHTHAIEKFSQEGVDLIVTVDLGITAIEAVARANELGIDVIITDHHLPQKTLPNAVAIINPNKNSCPSELGYLCGTGVAFYLVLALRMAFREKGLLTKDFDPKTLLDCFAIGTLTDLVPLVEENRILVKHGLKQLAHTQRPGLSALMEELGLAGRELTSQEVAIRFAPKLNALSRMETGTLPLDIYLEEKRGKASQLVEKVMTNNDLRIKLQNEAEKEAIEMLQNLDQQGYIWVWSLKFHKGVVGLVATKLSQTFGVPAFVGSFNSKTGLITGSARAPNNREKGKSVLEVLKTTAEHLKGFGGHAPAAGFELSLHKVDEFDGALARHYQSANTQTQAKATTLIYDAESCLEEISPQLMRWFHCLGPFGVGWEPITLRLSNLQLKSMKELRGGHLRLDVADQRGGRLEALWFSPPSDHPFITCLPQPVDKMVDLLCEPQWNYFAGQQTLQLLIKDLKIGS